MHTRYRITRWQVLAFSAATLVVLGFITSGWIRNTAAPWLFNQTVGHQVTDAFDRSFGSFNEQLGENGVHFRQGKTPPCHTAYYHYVRISIHCLEVREISNGDNNTPIPAALVSNWQAVLRNSAIGEQQGMWQVDKGSTNVANAASLFRFVGAARTQYYRTH